MWGPSNQLTDKHRHPKRHKPSYFKIKNLIRQWLVLQLIQWYFAEGKVKYPVTWPLTHCPFHPFPVPHFSLNVSLPLCTPVFPVNLYSPSLPPVSLWATLSIHIRSLGSEWVCVLSPEVLYSSVQSHAYSLALLCLYSHWSQFEWKRLCWTFIRGCLSPLWGEYGSWVFNWCTVYPLHTPFLR